MRSIAATGQLLGDAELNRLAPQVEVSNQNVAAAVAAYAQARALVSEQRAALYPSVSLTGGVSRAGAGSPGPNGKRVGHSFQVGLGASSELPTSGAASRLAVRGAEASAQASEADLASARLSAQAELATDYSALLARTPRSEVRSCAAPSISQRALKITQNGYDAGITAKTDVLAETTLANAQADLAAEINTRAQHFEHAIAVLVGKPPGD